MAEGLLRADKLAFAVWLFIACALAGIHGYLSGELLSLLKDGLLCYSGSCADTAGRAGCGASAQGGGPGCPPCRARVCCKMRSISQQTLFAQYICPSF